MDAPSLMLFVHVLENRSKFANKLICQRNAIFSYKVLFLQNFCSCLIKLIKIYKALIEPHFDYCSAVWDGLTQQLSEKLQKLQNRAIRVITKSSYDTSSRLLLTSLGWDNLSSRRAKQKANLMYKCINNLAPAYLCNLFLPRIPSYDFRNAKKKLLLPKPRTDYLKHSFSYSGAILWNNLPEEIRTSNSLAFFKRSYNKLFSDQYSHTANM